MYNFSWRSQGLLADDDFPDLADEIDESFYDQPSLRAYEYWYRQSFYPTPRTAHRRAEPPAPSAALPHRQQPPTTHRQATTAPAHSSSSRRVTYRPSPSTLPLSTRKIPGEPSCELNGINWLRQLYWAMNKLLKVVKFCPMATTSNTISTILSSLLSLFQQQRSRRVG